MWNAPIVGSRAAARLDANQLDAPVRTGHSPHAPIDQENAMSSPVHTPTERAWSCLTGEHRTLAAVLQSLRLMLRRGPGDAPEQFFDVVRAMLFYIDEFPERQHHPKESNLLFPKVVRAAPELMPVVTRLEEQHMEGHGRVRELQHLLVAWELLGESRRAAFEQEVEKYVVFYFDHMRLEEEQILPVAKRVLQAADWEELDRAFSDNVDPLAEGGDPRFERLFSRIVRRAPAPIGVGPG
jgi:hemerythrin-like domain-containing protein